MSETRTPWDGQLAIGIDLGGTNLRAAVYAGLEAARREGVAPAPIARVTEPVGEPRDPDHIAGRVAGVVESLLDGREAPSPVASGSPLPIPVGIGSPQPIPVGIGFAGMLRGDDGYVFNSPHMRWRHVPFGALVRERLGPRRQVAIVNDVNAITYGEHALGAGVGVDDVLAVFVGTGIGGGVIAGGRLVAGATGAAGEIGHFKVAVGDDAPPCACGRRGCVEAFAGGSYLQRRARAELAGAPQSAVVRLAGTADAIHPGHVDAAAEQGDPWALDLYAEIAPLLAVALANAVTLLNPARLILGGGVLSRTPVLYAHVVTALQLAVTDAAFDALEIVPAALGGDAGMVGAALLALESGQH